MVSRMDGYRSPSHGRQNPSAPPQRPGQETLIDLSCRRYITALHLSRNPYLFSRTDGFAAVVSHIDFEYRSPSRCRHNPSAPLCCRQFHSVSHHSLLTGRKTVPISRTSPGRTSYQCLFIRYQHQRPLHWSESRCWYHSHCRHKTNVPLPSIPFGVTSQPLSRGGNPY